MNKQLSAGSHLSGRGLEAGLVVGRVEEPLRGNDLHRPLGSVQQAVQPHRQRQVGGTVVGKGDVVRDVLHNDHSAGAVTATWMMQCNL